MANTDGLSRRRAAGQANRISSETSNGSGSRFQAVVKDEDEELSTPWLTLMEEVMLLGLKDKEGYLSFWNDSISYVLRGCIIMELALRRRIAIVREGAAYRRATTSLAERPIEVISERSTGEVLLDETLKVIKDGEQASIASWIGFLSGETWNLSKIGYQLKQVRERLAKGLVDKGVLRNERRNFLLFDMATHPVQDTAAKRAVIQKCLDMLLANAPPIPDDPAPDYHIRRVVMVCAAHSANVLQNALPMLDFEAKEATYTKVDGMMATYGQWPALASVSREFEETKLPPECLEVVAAVLNVYSRMGSAL